jgi:hypothetical protein
MDWLRRSGSGRAVALRRFLNQNLAALPSDCGASLCGRFGPNWDKAAYFEMIVGRFLQLTGASLLYEPESAAGKHVDFQASFASGTVFVEATSPDYNREGVQRVHYAEPLLDVLVAESPRGWWVLVDELPRQGPDDSRRTFRATVRALFAEVPDPTAAGHEHELVAELPNGRLAVSLMPGRPDTGDAIRMSPGPTLLENSWDRIVAAVRGKRAQARAFRGLGPVVLALDSAWYTDEDDFDLALFGGSHETLEPGGRLGPSVFHPSGVLARQQTAEFAAVLVFHDLGFVRGPDPVMYMHPKFAGRLPPELDFLERRELTDHGISVTPPARTGVLEALPFVGAAEFAEL